MQEPLDNLSGNARQVHENLAADPDATKQLDVIASEIGMSEGETANALRELRAGQRAVESFGGWSVLT